MNLRLIAPSQPLPYFFGSGVGAGLLCTAANGEVLAFPFALSFLGFFGSRPLRF